MKRLGTLICVLALVSVSSHRTYLSNNLSLPITFETVKFAVIGDYGDARYRDPASQNRPPVEDVANLVNGWNPEFIITVGDNNYPNGAQSTIHENIGNYYREFIDLDDRRFGRDNGVNRFFPSLGNHDWNTRGATPYLNYFRALPGNKRYYDFVKGPIHFYAIDSDPHERDGIGATSPQASWL